ncbi:UDP-glucose 4-epimerase family protein [Mesorhizobium japonicum]|uniref:UDP-glucose 4-epimerase family protein n=1 Tax=Mesorhizobium japonicum TaxID=2066070 RepID=UPI003B5ABBF0
MILLTGGSGFLGRALLTALSKEHAVRATFRQAEVDVTVPRQVEIMQASLSPDQDWMAVLRGVSTIIHCAARVHVMNDSLSNPLLEYRRINVDGTLNLARQAIKSGVRRFIFISSVKVNGEYSNLGRPFTVDQIPAPVDHYGISKYEAEMGLKALSAEAGMEIVIIRPPLIYGPGVNANFQSMMRWLQRGVPLPFGGIKKNRRSFIYLKNLVEIITVCITHPAAANQTFLVSDGEDLSTTELLRRMFLAMELPMRLIAVPPSFIRIGAKLIWRPDISRRLCDSLQVDIQKTKDVLGWSPRISVDDGLRQTAAYFLENSL